jgi:hypothetical protein
MVIQEEQVHNHTNQEEQIDVQMVQREEQMIDPLKKKKKHSSTTRNPFSQLPCTKNTL